MIRFMTIEGKNVSCEPRHIVCVESVTEPMKNKSLLSGDNPGTAAVRVTLVTGVFFVVPDPNGMVVSQIESAKKG